MLVGFGFSGFQLLCFLGLVNGFSMFSVFSGFCGGLWMTVVVVVVLFSVFCFAMNGGCHGGSGGGSGGGSSVVVVIYCVRYINLLCNKYYFNV